MRKREEIENEANYDRRDRIMLEVLLDIRDLLCLLRAETAAGRNPNLSDSEIEDLRLFEG